MELQLGQQQQTRQEPQQAIQQQPLNANLILEASSHIMKLRQLLAWDLATLRQHANSAFFPVQLTMFDSKNTQVILNTKELEEFLSSIVAKELNWLEQHGVDTTSIIDEYKTAAEKILGKVPNEG